MSDYVPRGYISQRFSTYRKKHYRSQVLINGKLVRITRRKHRKALSAHNYAVRLAYRYNRFCAYCQENPTPAPQTERGEGNPDAA